MTTDRVRRWRVAVAIAAGLVLGAGTAAVAQRGAGPKIGVEQMPASWDPHADLDPVSRSHWEHIYESLAQLGPRLQIEPSLATSWEQPDARTWVFHLRRGVLFHHGREMTADDVVYSFERGRARQQGSGTALDRVQSVAIVDKYTVKVTLAAPDGGFLVRLAANIGTAIVPRDVVERQHGSLKTTMVGTGPFRIKKYQAGWLAELERNPRYWVPDLPRVDSLAFLPVKDEGARIAEVRRGALDVVSVGDPRLAVEAVRDGTVRLSWPQPSRPLVLWLPQGRAPFKTKKLRQAVAAAVDRERLAQALVLGHGEVAVPGFAAPSDLGKEALERLPFYRHDRDAARKLLAQGGQPRGFEFSALVPSGEPDLQTAAQAVQAQLKEAGIAMAIQPVERATFAARWRSGDVQALFEWSDWDPDPVAALRPYLYSTVDADRGGYRNRDVDQLLDDARAAVDPGRRQELLRKLAALLAEDVPGVWLIARPARFDLTRARLRDYTLGPDFSRLELKRAVMGR